MKDFVSKLLANKLVEAREILEEKLDELIGERLTEEIGDLIAMIELCYDNDIVDYVQVKEAQTRKFDKLKKWSTIYEQTKNI